MGRKRRTGGRVIHPDLQAKINEIAQVVSLRQMALTCGLSHAAFNPAANGQQNLSEESASLLAQKFGRDFHFTETIALWWVRNPNGDPLRALPAGPGSLALAGDPALAEAQADLTEQLAALRRQHPDDDQFRRLPRLATASMRALDDAIAAERHRILAGYQHVAADHGYPAGQQDQFVDVIMARNAAWDARHGAPDDGES